MRSNCGQASPSIGLVEHLLAMPKEPVELALNAEVRAKPVDAPLSQDVVPRDIDFS